MEDALPGASEALLPDFCVKRYLLAFRNLGFYRIGAFDVLGVGCPGDAG